jgi:hypothetical protein
MQTPPCPVDDEFRIEALHELKLLDSKPDAKFDRIVRVTRQLFDIEICLISLVDNHRQWFKAKVGLDAEETPRDISFCGHAILFDDVFVVKNALDDQRFFDNPLVTGAPHIRFYAGAPLKLPNGYKIGTLCIISPVARPEFAEKEITLLRDLGSLVVDLIALDEVRKMKDDAVQRTERYEVLSGISKAPMATANHLGEIDNCNEAFEKAFGPAPTLGKTLKDLLGLPVSWAEQVRSNGELFATHQQKNESAETIRVMPFRDGFILCR